MVVPVVLAGGKALFQSVSGRHPLELLETRTLQSGLVRLRYRWRDRNAPEMAQATS
ncbi:hypothetical protein [Anaeromyxobacter sp. Fw109-5]|uniref:hypothetical protein n=1 Tax=Anaeromyxobacter sp. (strain Fw109-5) TaxID=404589 RepID=UPI00117DC4EA|nr:hypothetical protein [Anaeromyxobacter sp. Fw109-5]